MVGLTLGLSVAVPLVPPSLPRPARVALDNYLLSDQRPNGWPINRCKIVPQSLGVRWCSGPSLLIQEFKGSEIDNMVAPAHGNSKSGNDHGAPKRRRGPGTLATVYLVIYNVIMTAGWLVIAVGLVRAYLTKGSYHGLYYAIEKPLKYFQTGALLEILHCAFGIVPSSVVLTAFQVMSRVFLTWAVTHSVREVQNEDSVLLFVVAWTITEIIRYSFYTFSLLNHLPYIVKWARYTLFIVLYPMGVAGELLTIYAALPIVRKTSLYSIMLPNKYNFSFDYHTFLILVMISYIPLFPQLYFHMIHQRRKVLGNREEAKKYE